jgi:glucosamine-6-phosphate deaminase
MSDISKKDLYNWCKIPFHQLEGHPGLKNPFRLTRDSDEMGEVMARDFVEEIKAANTEGKALRAIVPCGPK